MTDALKGKGAANPGPANIDFASALDGVSEQDFLAQPTTSKKVDANDTRRGSENAGFPSRPVVKQAAGMKDPGAAIAQQLSTSQRAKPAARVRARPKRRKETARVALRTDPEMFELLKDLAAEQDPPWTVGYAFEKAVQALEEKLNVAR